MIIVINGPLGIGKTETSWRLASSLDSVAMIDGDYVAAFSQFDYYNQRHLDHVYSTIRELILHHIEFGIEHFLINWVFEQDEQLNKLKNILSDVGMAWIVFRLICEPTELERRICKRGREDIPRQLERARELCRILDTEGADGRLGNVIDTTNLSIEETGEIILREVHGKTKATSFLYPSK